jgi:DNA polymerase I-like protein with 3'-5' exonuclease and polymerase domains
MVAPAGRALVIADLGQIELRVACELSGDPTMRRAFEDGRDLHLVTASAITGVAEADVTADQRNAAKPINYGCLYGQGAKGLRATAWADYGIDMSLAEAEAARAALRARYPLLLHWQRRMVNLAKWPGIVRSKLGRPLRREWEPGGEIRYSLAMNFPIQASAADVLLVAMAKAAAALEGLDAAIILQVHDELVLEVAEGDAEAARDRLVEAMTAAWLEVFPGAPTLGLVDAAIRPCWAKPPKE